MPAAKDNTEKEPVKAKKTPAKASAKKTTAKASPAEKKTTTAKKSGEKKAAAATKTTAVEKKTPVFSKGKQRKLRVEDKFNGRRYYNGVGKRKTSTAIVRLHEEGKGEMFINNKKIDEYFIDVQLENALQPLTMSDNDKSFDITIKVDGGGVSAQSDAVRLGISRALIEFNADLRPLLKKAGFLTRDSREKERKKPGLKRARRAPQWKKR
jgi:small subunit ribosomal protein S9